MIHKKLSKIIIKGLIDDACTRHLLDACLWSQESGPRCLTDIRGPGT